MIRRLAGLMLAWIFLTGHSFELRADPTGDLVQTGRTLFETRCFVCHGRTGQGNGPAAVGLNPPPVDFTKPSWQASVSDADLMRVIKDGGAALGRSAVMPPNADLNEQQIEALIAFVRSLKSQN
ncbi:MAG: cytochrome c [Verrucomicrobia bacterium]|nr:cytochrome c [Verrucomicrobiota bacterium]